MAASLRYLRSRAGALREQLRQLPRTFGLVWRAAPAWTLGWGALVVAQGLLPVATVALTRELVDGLVAAREVAGAWSALRPVLLVALAMAGVLLLGELLSGISGWLRTAQAGRVQEHISARIHAQAAALDLSFYETPAYYDRLYRAVHDARSRPISLLESLGRLGQHGITLLAMGAVLIPFGPWIPAVLLLSTLPALWVVVRHARREHEWRMATTERERRSLYYDLLLTGREGAAELRLFDLSEPFRAAFQELRGRLRGERERLAREQGLSAFAAAACGLIVTAGVGAWAMLRTLRGVMSLGELAFFFQAFYQGQRMLRSLLAGAGEVYANSLFLQNLYDFLDLEPRMAAPLRPLQPPPRPEGGVEFEGVCFRYAGSDRWALQDFDLRLPAGRIVAVVGANGAGKSTLIKLLCRFYDPEKGAIRLDGRDLRSFDPAALRRGLTVLFQEPMRYSETAARNIELGDLRQSRGRDAVVAAARAAGADVPIRGLPQGYDTLLGRNFSAAAELSVGEWQRVALARALLRPAPILLLDEPTSALDPWAEEEWLQRLRRGARGRSVLLITHRLSTARFADEIHVLEAGRVVESGGHEELVAGGGRYAATWRARPRHDGSRPAAARPRPDAGGLGGGAGGR